MFGTVILMIVVLVLLFILLRFQRKLYKYPPGPFALPFIGNHSLVKRLTREFGAQHLAFMELSRRYGSDVIALRFGASNVVVVSGNKALPAVLNSSEFDGRPWNEFIKMRNMGKKTGITMNDGEEWKEMRSWMVRALKTVGFGNRTMSELIKDELIAVLDNLKDGGVRKMKPVIAPAVINVLWTIATGKRLCEGPRLDCFIDLMERRSRVFDMAGGLLSVFPWIRYIAPEISGYNLLVTLNKQLKSFLMDVIGEHKKKYVSGGEADLIDLYLRRMFATDESNSAFTDEQLVMILVDLFLAGCTTTSTTLDFLFLNMAVHQDVQKKLHEEIDSMIPSSRLPDLTDRPKLIYAEAVLTETQRQYVPFPVIGPRRVVQDTSLENYKIPKDTTLLLNIASVHLDPNLFPDPEAFKPERFIKDGAYEANESMLFFGKGKRRCPGEVLARDALFLLFIGVMQKYTLLPVPGKGPFSVEIVSGLGISPKPYELLVVPR